MDRVIIKYSVPAAVLLSLIVTAVGVYLSIKFEAAWMSRTGSVVIVIGVLLAVVRIDERIHSLTDAFLTEQMPALLDRAIKNVAASGGGLISQVEAVESHEQKIVKIKTRVAEFAKYQHRVVGYYEVGIVCFGTLANGFGEVVMKAVISACT